MEDLDVRQLLTRLAAKSRVPGDAQTVTVEHGHLDEERLDLSERRHLSKWIRDRGGESLEYQVDTFGTFSGPGSEWIGYWRVPRSALE